MLEKLHIRNYRILRELKIDQLRRINLIAGGNNSGKTSLLEAIFLLGGAGSAHLLMNANVTRGDLGAAIQGVSIQIQGDTFWKPLFSDLDVSKRIEIRGHRPSRSQLTLEISTGGQRTIERSQNFTDRASETNLPDIPSLRMQYRGHQGKQVTSHIHVQGQELKFDQPRINVPFPGTILLSRTVNVQEDVNRLARLRQQKRDHLLLKALQVIEPALQRVEENSASGAPMIWGDIGLSELVPLAVMGEGMNRLARLVLGISSAPKGVVLIDEIENGFHHSALPEIWRAIDAAARQFNTQVIATTHSFECVSAAHESLNPDDFRLHRLDVIDDTVRCVTYEPETIAAALRHNLEVR